MKLDKLLVPVDFSDATVAQLSYAKVLAGQFNSEIHLFHANEALMAPVSAESFGFEQMAYQSLLDQIEKGLAEKVEGLAETLRRDGFRAVSSVASGRAHLKISEYAEDTNCGLILVGTTGHTRFHNFMLGSTTERLLRLANKPVMSIHTGSMILPLTLKTILVPLDLSSDSEKVVPAAITWAQHFKSRILFLHVDVLGEYMNAEKEFLPNATDRYPELHRVAHEKIILDSEKIPEEILRFAVSEKVDCIMQTSHGAGKLSKALLGSKADEIIHKSPVPVVTYRIHQQSLT